LDEKISTKEGILPFGFRERVFSKKKVTCVKEENLFPFLLHLGNQGSLLGNTTKRVSKSPTGLDLSHNIIGVNDAKVDFGNSKRNDWTAQNENTGEEDDGVDEFSWGHKSPPSFIFS
jgi:hypothetical protein